MKKKTVYQKVGDATRSYQFLGYTDYFKFDLPYRTENGDDRHLVANGEIDMLYSYNISQEEYNQFLDKLEDYCNEETYFTIEKTGKGFFLLLKEVEENYYVKYKQCTKEEILEELARTGNPLYKEISIFCN